MDNVDITLLMASAPVVGGAIGIAAAYVRNMRQEITKLSLRIIVLESEVSYLFNDDDPDDPDEGEAEPLPQNVVAIGGRK